jgi:hypothetical protein
LRKHNRSVLAPALLLVVIGAIGLRAATAATTTYTITPDGPPLTVTIASAGDDAAVGFDGTAGQRVSLKLSSVTIGPSGCCSTKVSILKPDGTTLVAPTNVGTLGGFLDAKTLPATGTYTIFVDPQGSATGSITLTLYDVHADLTGTIVPGGPAVTVTTTTPGQNARLTFSATTAQRVSVKVAPLCCSTKVSILRPDGTTQVAPVSLGTTGGLVGPTTLPVSGTYTLVVDPQNSTIGGITLTLYDVPADLTGTIVPGGPAVTVTTTTPGQNARLTFSGTAAGRVSLKVGPTCCSVSVSILKPDGTSLVTPTTFGTSGGFVDVKTLPVTGTYTLVVDPQSWAAGSVTLTLYDVPADVSATIVPGGPAVMVTTTAPGQNARLTFDGAAGSRISLNLTAVTLSSTRVSILNPDGTTLVAPTTVGTAGAFIDPKTLPASGTYAIVVDPQTTATGSMTLSLYDVPADASMTAVAGGAAVTVTTTTPGQNARVTFGGVVDQRVSVQLSGVTIGTSACCSAKISILKPDGSTLVAAMNFGTSGGFIDGRTLTVDGTYTILVDPQSSATGSATVLVNDVTEAAIPIVPGGPAVTVTTTTAGENARLAFDGTAGGRVSLTMTAVTIANSTVSILKPDGTTLTSVTGVSTSGGFIDAKALPVDGRYTIVVDPQGTATGKMTLKLYDVPADASATAVPGGTAVSVGTTTPGQNAAVRFTGAAGQRVFVKLSSVTIGNSTCCSTRVSLLRPDSTTLVAPTSVGTSGGFLDTATLPVAGEYTIFIDPQSTATGGITLTVYDVPPDVTDTTSPGGPSVTVTTTTPGQNAKVTFDGAAGRQVSMRVAWTPTLCCLIKVSIMRPDGGTVLAPFSVGATGAFIDAKLLPVTGTYTILVDPQNSAAGTTTLTLFDVPPDVTAPITPGGPAVTLTTTADGQNARFTFSATAGEGALVTVGPNCCATNVSILKPDGVAVAPPMAFQAAGGTLTARLPVTGEYTILVDLQGQATGSVTVRLVLDSGAPAPPVLTITESSADGHGDGATFYYRPAGAGGSFTVNAATSDTGTGIQKVTFPGLSGGFTPTLTTSDFSSPYNQAYTWATAATFSSTNNTVTVFDGVGNTSNAKFTVVPDSTPPTTTDDTAAIGSGWKNTTQTVTLSPVDGGSGIGTTYYTTNGSTPTTGSAQGPLVTLSADGMYTIKYLSVDNVGNVEPVRTASTQIRIDKTNPSSAITFPVSGRSYNAAGWNAGCAAAGFCGTASDALSGVQRVELSIRQGSGSYWDGAAFASASEVFHVALGTTGWSFAFAAASFPADGTYTIRVRAVDNATNVEAPLSRTFTFDSAPPETTITAAPTNPSNSTAPSFSFSANEAGSTFQCSLDGAAFAACTSPKSYTGLAAGAHTFRVRATDPAGNTDATPASHSWTIDLTAPDTTITSGPPAATTDTSASFSFTSSEAGSTFQCSLDGGAFAACASPKSYAGLAGGTHTFRVRASDTAGNTDGSPAQYNWTVDLTAPQTTILTAPASSTNSTSASFTFGASEAGSSFECSLDGAPFLACTSPQSYSGLAEGAHSFQVRATDPAGNTDGSPATHNWTIDLVAPDTTITASPPSLSNSASASFSFSSTEAGTFQCSLDAGAFTACTSPRTYTGLAAGAHNFRVRAVDAAGNTDASAASYGWTIDLSAPETAISSGPPAVTDETSASFSFTASEAGSTFECSLDGAAFGPCMSPASYSALAEGPHNFRVRATDEAGNTDPSPASSDWTVDLTAPDTTIGSGPADPTNQTAASFSFSASEAGSTLECSLDGGAFEACTSPQAYSGLAEGDHSFEVRATDAAGNMDASPATYSWTVDVTAPAAPAITDPPTDITIQSATVTVGGTAETGALVVLFDGASSVGSATADGAGAWSVTLAGVADGAHSYSAQATDAAGNTSSASTTRTVTVDTSAPDTTISAGPSGSTNATSATFEFSASEGGSSFECSLDGAAFAACTSQESYSGLAEGIHSFQVRATDGAGNTDATPASRDWTVDLTAPDTTIAAGPGSSTSSTSATFGFSATEPGSTFQCSLDGGPFEPCASPRTYSGLAEGVHSFDVKATDPAGNADAIPASYGWTVDISAPETTIAAGPADPTNQTSASFSFSASEGGSTFECSLDGAAFASCTSPENYSGLADGAHTFRVRATDAVGNTDSSPASYGWTIDVTAPETTIDSGSADPTNQTSASFAFGSSEAGSSFECSLDGAAFASCTSPESYSALAEGAHNFQVRATDAVGNTDATPASHSWAVDQTAPETTILAGPTDPTTETSASFSFSASEGSSTFACSLDGAAYSPCTSPQDYAGLGPGSHLFEVRATDGSGNTDASPAAQTWTVL